MRTVDDPATMGAYPSYAHLLSFAVPTTAPSQLPPWRLPGAFADPPFGDERLQGMTRRQEDEAYVDALWQECEEERHFREFEEFLAARRIPLEELPTREERRERQRRTGVKVRKDKSLWTRLRKNTRH